MASEPQYSGGVAGSQEKSNAEQEKDPYTQTPNTFYDTMLSEIDSICELKVTLAVIRQTNGFHREECEISLSEFESLTGLCRTSVVTGIELAMKRGYVLRNSRGKGYIYAISGVARDYPQGVATDYSKPTVESSERLPSGGSERLPPYIKKEIKESSGVTNLSIKETKDGNYYYKKLYDGLTEDNKRVGSKQKALELRNGLTRLCQRRLSHDEMLDVLDRIISRWDHVRLTPSTAWSDLRAERSRLDKPIQEVRVREDVL